MKSRVLLCALIFVAVMAGAWEGNAAVAPAGELPEDGFFVATNSFPRNTVVEVRNIENNKSVRVIVASGLSSQGLLAMLSKTAASVIGISSSSVARIELIQPADPVGYSMFTQGRASSGDPDFDPRAQQFDESVLNSSRSSSGNRSGYSSGSSERIVDLPDYLPPPQQQSQPQVTQAQPITPSVSRPIESEPYNRTSDFEPGPDLVYPDSTLRNAQNVEPQIAAVPDEPRTIERAEPIIAAAPVEPPVAAEPVKPEEHAAYEVAQVEKGPDADLSDAKIAYVEPEFRPEESLAQVEEESEFDLEEAEEAIANADPNYENLEPEVEEGLAQADEGEDVAVAYLEPTYKQQPTDPFYPGDDVMLVMEPADLNPPSDEIYIDEVYVIRPIDTEPATPTEVTITAPFLPPIPSLYPVPQQVAEPTGPMVPPIAQQVYAPPETSIYVPPAYVPPPSKPSVPTAVAIEPEVSDVANRFSVPVIADLEKGKYYLQLGSYEGAEAIEAELTRIGRSYPLAIQKTIRSDKPVYRILLGPMNIGESNAMLQRFKSNGYADAFLRYN